MVYFPYRNRFEFDPAKSASNKVKHGIDFIEAQALWSDENRVELRARSIDEERIQLIGCIESTLWSAVVTHRHDSIRLISVRRARWEEERRYRREA